MSLDLRKSNAELVDELAGRVNRLGTRSLACDVEKFLGERDDIARDLRTLAKLIRGDPPRRSPTTTWRPPFDV